jgi:L,D-peptidoglycan transpeptidase YkuD (ErfK/YbiS/YcfS/YnhG family)
MLRRSIPGILATLVVIGAAMGAVASLGSGAAIEQAALREPAPVAAAGAPREPRTVAVSGAPSAPASRRDRGRFTIPSHAEQLIVVSSPTLDPPAPGYLAGFGAYQRASRSGPWKRVFGPWQAETGSGHLIAAAQRRAGDHATPLGVYGVGTTMYGTEPNPGGLHYEYHQLICGDWWDEDPYSSQYSRFVHVPCGETPDFASWSEALWTEGKAYPYLAVIDFNTGPIVAGADARGAGIFLHSWMGTSTEGCVALPESQLLEVLRWLRPRAHPVIEIGLNHDLAALS